MSDITDCPMGVCVVKLAEGDECLMTSLTPLSFLSYQPAGADTIESCSAHGARHIFAQDVCLGAASHSSHARRTGQRRTLAPSPQQLEVSVRII